MEQLIIHKLVQGSPEWDQFRLNHDGASEAAAMLGLSTKVKRTELLHAKHIGIAREFSDWLQKNVLDRGHEVEALARPLIEEIIGDELYPVTCSRGRISASCDGLTDEKKTAMEHKQWAKELAESVRDGIVPEEHMPQCQQVLMVTGAEKLLFVVSDGTPENMVLATVLPDPAWFERLQRGWAQFHEDLKTYTPPATAPAVVAEPVQALPAVLVQVSGEITVKDNFKVFETALRDFLEHRLIREPKTDQDFADLDLQIKAMKGAEEALAGAESQMLAQVQSIDQAKKTKDMLAKLVRDNRLMAEKLLASEKERRRGEIVAGGIALFKAHIESLNQRLGKPYMPIIPADFGGAIKGMKSMTSMEDAVATTLAAAKIEANAVADRIQINLTWLRENATEYASLFPDTAQLVLKPADDFKAVAENRIATHKAAEKRKEEEIADRIRKEEQDRIAREAAAASQKLIDDAAKFAQATAAAPALKETLPAATPQPEIVARIVVMPTEKPTLKLGDISERLGFTLTADFLAELGYVGKQDGKAKLYHESDWPAICQALIQHITQVSDLQVA